MCSPLAVIVQQARHAIIDPNAPNAAEAIGGGARLLIPFGIAIAVCVLGYSSSTARRPHIAEEL